MVRLNDSEKNELLQGAGSSLLREEMRRLIQHKACSHDQDRTVDFDAGIQFFSQINAFAGHASKPFVKMVGEHFVL